MVIESEIDRLKEQLVSSANNHPHSPVLLTARRPILKVNDATMRGYRRLQDQEWDLRVETFLELPDLIAVWIHYFDLYEQAINLPNKDAGTSTPKTLDDDYAFHLQVRLFALVGGTAKLMFDAACAGLYVQSYALCRHVEETWVTIAYVVARPDMANRWFDERPDDPSHKPPKDTTMHAEIRKNARTKQMINVLEKVLVNIRRYDELSHPGEKSLEQTISKLEDQVQVGGTFNRRLAIGSLHEGAGAFRILLQLWNQIIPQPEEWSTKLSKLAERHHQATDLYTSDQMYTP